MSTTLAQSRLAELEPEVAGTRKTRERIPADMSVSLAGGLPANDTSDFVDVVFDDLLR